MTEDVNEMDAVVKTSGYVNEDGNGEEKEAGCLNEYRKENKIEDVNECWTRWVREWKENQKDGSERGAVARTIGDVNEYGNGKEKEAGGMNEYENENKIEDTNKL